MSDYFNILCVRAHGQSQFLQYKHFQQDFLDHGYFSVDMAISVLSPMSIPLSNLHLSTTKAHITASSVKSMFDCLL